jgi:hypothetical protein
MATWIEVVILLVPKERLSSEQVKLLPQGTEMDSNYFKNHGKHCLYATSTKVLCSSDFVPRPLFQRIVSQDAENHIRATISTAHA